MNKKEIIKLLKDRSKLHHDSYENYMEQRREAMDKHNLPEAIKIDRWASDCIELEMELNYIISLIEKGEK